MNLFINAFIFLDFPLVKSKSHFALIVILLSSDINWCICSDITCMYVLSYK